MLFTLLGVLSFILLLTTATHVNLATVFVASAFLVIGLFMDEL